MNQRKILEAAAKACRLSVLKTAHSKHGLMVAIDENSIVHTLWNPLTNPADTAEMCAKLDINTYWHINEVECSTSQNIVTSHSEQHNGTDAGKESAQRLAAMMVAAKIGDLK